MLQAWGRRTSPTTPSSKRTGVTHIRYSLVHNAILAPSVLVDAALREAAAPAATCRTPSPAGHQSAPEKPLAGRVTPLKLARLSELLRLPVTRVETILQASPAAVRHMEPERIALRLHELCAALGIRPKQAAFMVSKQPAYMLLTPLAGICAKIQELSDVLRVPTGAVLRTALTVPSILRRGTAFTDRRVKAYSALLRCTPLDVLHVMARGPEYLTDTPTSVRHRMAALGYVLRRPRCTIAGMLQARPDLVFMSGKVMNTKVNGLMCIMNKQKHHVITLVVKLPALLRCNLDSVRCAFEGLQVLLQKREGFVYAMVCHAPSLLLLTPRGLHQRCSALRRCLAASPDWCNQFAQLRPPGVAQLILNRRGSLSAMMFLAQRRIAGAAPLEKLLSHGPDGGPMHVLGEAWPEFLEWMERRRQHAVLRMRQQKVAMRGAIEGAARTGVDGPQGPVSGLVQVQQLPLSHQQFQPQEQSQRLVQQQVFAAADVQVPAGQAAAAPAFGVHIAGRDPLRHSQAGLRGAGMHVLQRPLAANVVSTSSGTCSITNGGGRSNSRTSRSSRSVEHEHEGILQQDGGSSEGAADRGQRSDASTSGRQLSWLQLQVEYSRSLQSGDRRKVVMASQRVAQAGGTAQAGPVDMSTRKHFRLRRRQRPKQVDLLASAATVMEGATGAAGMAPDCTGQDMPERSTAALRSPTLQSVEDGALSSTFDSVSMQESVTPVVPAGLGARAADRTERRHAVGDELDGGGLQTSEASSAVRAAPRWSPTHASLHASDFGKLHHGHVLGQTLMAGCGQPSDSGLAHVGLDRQPTASGSSGALKLAVSAPAAPHTVAEGPPLALRMDSRHEWDAAAPAAGGEPVNAARRGNGSTWPAPTAANSGADHVENAIGHQRAVDPGSPSVPLWLHLGSNSVISNVSGQAHDDAGSSELMVDGVRHGESQCRSSRRTVANPTGPAQLVSTDEVIVVSGDGSMRDIKGLGRESHARGLRGQEPGGGLSVEQTQKLESALGAAVPW